MSRLFVFAGALLVMSCGILDAPESTPVVRRMDITPSFLMLPPGDTSRFTVVARAADNSVVTKARARWSSSDPSVATVNGGLVTALAVGATIITAATDSAQVSVPVTVTTGWRTVAEVSNITGRPFGVGVDSLSNLSKPSVYVARLDADAASIVDAQSYAVTGEVATGIVPGDLAFTPDGNEVFITNNDGASVSVIGLRPGVQSAVIPLPANPFRIHLAADPLRMFVLRNDGKIAVIRIESRQVEAMWNVTTDALNGIAVPWSGGVIYVSSVAGTLFKIDANTGHVRLSRVLGGTPQEVVITHDGSALYVANEAGWVDRIDPVTLDRVDQISVPGAFGMALSADESTLLVSSSGLGHLYAIDRGSFAVTETINVGCIPRRIAFFNGLAWVSNECDRVDVLHPGVGAGAIITPPGRSRAPARPRPQESTTNRPSSRPRR